MDNLPNEILTHIAGFNAKSKHTVHLDGEGRAVFSMDGLMYARIHFVSLRGGKIVDHDSCNFAYRSSDVAIAKFIDGFAESKIPWAGITLPGTAVGISLEKWDQGSGMVFKFTAAHCAFYLDATSDGVKQVHDLLVAYLKFKQRTPKYIKQGRYPRHTETNTSNFDWDVWFSAHE